MDKIDTLKAIKVMQAYVDGKDVEFRSIRCSNWHSVNKPTWNFHINEYRIKRVSRKIYINEYPNGLGRASESLKESIRLEGLNSVGSIKRSVFIEMSDDEQD